MCVCEVFTDGLAGSVNGIGKFDIGMKIFSLADATIQITKSKNSIPVFILTEKAERTWVVTVSLKLLEVCIQILFKPILVFLKPPGA